MPTSRTRADRSDADRNPVEILADEFARRLRGGEHPTIDEYVQRYPEHADLVRTLFPPIEMMERVSQQEQSDGQIEPPSTAGFRLSTDTIGDFRIIREIGRGGMGVVYEALQQSLNRRVALKILGPAVAGSRSQLARFRREAEAAARLHHTNIVPIFGTGTDGDLHFYVMQFIDGVSLNDVVQWLGNEAPPKPPSEKQPHRASGRFSCQPRASAPRLVACTPPSERQLSPKTQFTAADAAAILLAGTVQDRSSLRGASVESAVTDVPSTDSINESPNESPRTASDASEDAGVQEPFESQNARSCVCRNADTSAVFPHSRECSYGPERNGAYWSNVAKIGADLAGALSYSHQQGVLHRDIKPSNILLDRDGIVWVADFGLAKHEDQEGVTQAGDIVGTLRYMAPEQFRGRTDNRSDIYSLGLTLYELLTLRPAFDDTRHGPLIEQKLSSTQPSPRGIVPGIPRDLDTIVAKACAPDPDHRYESAAQLAADLQRFLDDRPILARRVLSAERLWRWARRNPWIATLSLSTAVFLIATAVVFAIGKHRTEQTLALLAEEKGRVERALGQVEQEKQRAEQQRGKAVIAAEKAGQAQGQAEENLRAARRENARAEKNLQVAVEAFEQIIQNIASRGIPESLAVVPGEEISVVTPADAELLEMLLAFFDQFAKHNEVDFAAESAAALKRVGDIHQQLGRLDEAEEAYRQALAAYGRLDTQDDTARSHVVQRARIINALANINTRRGNIPQAIGAHRMARNLLEREGPVASAESRFELARTLIQKALIGESSGLERDGSGGDAIPGGESGHGPPGRGKLRGGRGRGGPGDGDPLDNSDVAIETLKALVAEDPSNPDYRLALSQAYRARVRTLIRLGEHESAIEPLRTAVEVLEELAADVPDTPALQYGLADTLRTQLLSDESYEQRVRRAVAASEQLTAEHPDVPPYQSLAGDCLGQLGEIQLGEGDLDAAEENYERAIEYKRPLSVRFRSELPAQISYARTLAGFAEVQIARNEISAARALLDEALLCLETFERGHGPNRFVGRLLNQIQKRRANLPPTDS